MIISYAKGWAKTIDLNGKTNRKEFWSFVIIDLIILGSLLIFDTTKDHLGAGTALYFLLGWVSRITILTRRLRDSGRNSYWMFWYFVPVIGWAILILLALQPSYSSTSDPMQVRVIGNLNEENSDKKTNEQSLQSKLEEFKRLKKEGLVSEEEYEQLRKKTLGL